MHLIWRDNADQTACLSSPFRRNGISRQNMSDDKGKVI